MWDDDTQACQECFASATYDLFMGETEPTDAQYAEYEKQVDDDYNSYTCFDGSNYLMVSAGAALAAGLALIY